MEKFYIIENYEIKEIEEITNLKLEITDNKIKKVELDKIIQKLIDKVKELIEEKRKILGWQIFAIDDMYFNFNGLVLSQRSYSGILNDLIDEYNNLQEQIEDIKKNQEQDGYILLDGYDEIVERELLNE